LDNFFSFFLSSIFFSLLFLSLSSPRIQSSRTTKDLITHTHHRTKIIHKNGESTRRVLLGARMAVREEEQRARPRVRQPNAHVRGERQRDREARI